MDLPPEKDMRNARHHWWPGSLSRFWADKDGNAHRISWDGKEVSATPYNFGGVKNAHHIKMADIPTVWDENYEPKFGNIDGRFPSLVRWIESLGFVANTDNLPLSQRAQPQPVTDEQFYTCAECAVSIAVRNPAFRNRIRLTVQSFRGSSIGEDELDRLIGLNQRDCQNLYMQAIGTRGKIAILVSKNSEFIFGDGFFHNFTSTSTAPMTPRLILPLTPNYAVFYTKPVQFLSEPRLVTISLRRDEVQFLNDTVQVYSKDAVFYRTERPSLLSEFTQREFLEYRYNSHPAIDVFEQFVAWG